MQKFQFFTASPLKMRACGTGRKFAEYDQREFGVAGIRREGGGDEKGAAVSGCCHVLKIQVDKLYRAVKRR
jgi:hypothetical protein